MSRYATLLGELAVALGLDRIDMDESGHGALTIDKLWTVHVAPLYEGEMVLFLRGGLLASDAQAGDQLRANLFSLQPVMIRCALDQNDHLILWCQLSLAHTDVSRLCLVLSTLVDRAETLSRAPSSARKHEPLRESWGRFSLSG